MTIVITVHERGGHDGQAGGRKKITDKIVQVDKYQHARISILFKLALTKHVPQQYGRIFWPKCSSGLKSYSEIVARK